jgi:hypothetical protein
MTAYSPSISLPTTAGIFAQHCARVIAGLLTTIAMRLRPGYLRSQHEENRPVASPAAARQLRPCQIIAEALASGISVMWLLVWPAQANDYRAQDFHGAVSGTACTWDSTHDVGDCINAAIRAVNAAGGGTVIVPAGSYGQTVTISQSPSNNRAVSIIGSGAPGNYGICSTTLTWLDGAGGAMVSMTGTINAVVGGGIRHICLDGNDGTAATIVRLRGIKHAWFEDVFAKGASAMAWDIDAIDQADGGVIDNWFVNDNIDLGGAGSKTANGWVIGQGAFSTGNNTGDNHWIGGLVQYQNGTGFVCGAADSNEILGMDIQPVSGGTGKSLDMLGHASNAMLACRSNRFMTTGGFGRSNRTAPVAETAAQPSLNNYIYQNTESGAGLPSINGSATLTYDTNTGLHYSNASGALSIIAPKPASSLPLCDANMVGALQTVFDSNTATWGARVAGGGANRVLAYCDGTNWTVVAK